MLSAKLGIATGQNLAELCRAYFPRPVVIGMWVLLEVVAMAPAQAAVQQNPTRQSWSAPHSHSVVHGTPSGTSASAKPSSSPAASSGPSASASVVLSGTHSRSTAWYPGTQRQTGRPPIVSQ
jgi:hypothetical protein